MGGKTGFISKAGYCLATLLRLPRRQSDVAVVVLGATSNTGRFWETRHLFNWLSQTTADLCRKTAEPAAGPASRQRPIVALLHRCRVQRQRRHSIHNRHHRARGAPRVVRLDVALAHVARVEPVLAIAAGERRDLRAVGVQAERAGELARSASARRSGRRSAAGRRQA